MLRQGLAMLDWLLAVQTAAGHLSPVGNTWWRSSGPRARFDQQPIEAASLLMAAEAALGATGNPRYRDAMEQAFGWYLGRNDLSVPVADPARGACHDGLTPTGVNLNQGAESTLMWLVAVERMAVVRATDLPTRPAAGHRAVRSRSVAARPVAAAATAPAGRSA
jgi:hypothetical protein